MRKDCGNLNKFTSKDKNERTFVNELKGVKNTEVSLSTKEVSVEFESPATLEQIKEVILDSGFEVC